MGIKEYMMVYKQPGNRILSVYVLRFVQYEYRTEIGGNAYAGDIVSARVIFTAPARRLSR